MAVSAVLSHLRALKISSGVNSRDAATDKTKKANLRKEPYKMFSKEKISLMNSSYGQSYATGVLTTTNL